MLYGQDAPVELLEAAAKLRKNAKWRDQEAGRKCRRRGEGKAGFAAEQTRSASAAICAAGLETAVLWASPCSFDPLDGENRQDDGFAICLCNVASSHM